MALRFRSIVEDYEAKLHPADHSFAGTNAQGKAEWERFGNGQEEFDVRVRGVEVMDGSTLTVYLERHMAGQIIIKSKRGRLRIESRNGNIVPSVTLGSKIIVQIDGAKVLEGTFVKD